MILQDIWYLNLRMTGTTSPISQGNLLSLWLKQTRVKFSQSVLWNCLHFAYSNWRDSLNQLQTQQESHLEDTFEWAGSGERFSHLLDVKQGSPFPKEWFFSYVCDCVAHWYGSGRVYSSALWHEEGLHHPPPCEFSLVLHFKIKISVSTPECCVPQFYLWPWTPWLLISCFCLN